MPVCISRMRFAVFGDWVIINRPVLFLYDFKSPHFLLL